MHSDKETKEVVVYTKKEILFYFPFTENYDTYKVDTEVRLNVLHSWDFEDFENSQKAYEPYCSERIESTPTGTLLDAIYVFHKSISSKFIRYRGRGKPLRFRFESDGIYPVNLLRYSHISSRDADY